MGKKLLKDFLKARVNSLIFKKKKQNNVKAYFPKNNTTDWTIKRHVVKIPTFGFIQVKEKGYIPIDSVVTSGTVSYEAGRYYVSVLVKEDGKTKSSSVFRKYRNRFRH